MRVRTPFAVLLAVLLASLLVGVAACSGSDADAEGEDPTTTAGGESAGVEFDEVTIEHAYGETPISERPQRIVSLDTQWTDALPYEQIAALEPDLIVVTYLAQDEEDYQTLSAIAPTIATLSDNQVDTWQDITDAAGQVLGEPEAAQRVIEQVDGQVASVGEELPGLDGQTFALVNYVKGDAFYVVSDPQDGAVVLFTQLGMVISPEIIEAGDGASGRATISLERTDLLDADLLLLLTNGEDPSSIPGYDSLPAVAAGAAAQLDYATAVAVNTPTPLSIPWALQELRPQLEAAAAE